METEFQSRISFEKQTTHVYRNPKTIYYANVYWNGKLYETTKATKKACIEHLERIANPYNI